MIADQRLSVNLSPCFSKHFLQAVLLSLKILSARYGQTFSIKDGEVLSFLRVHLHTVSPPILSHALDHG